MGGSRAILDRLRQERKERPGAIDDLLSWYSFLAMPEYTESQDIPEHCTKLAEWRREFPNSPTPLIVLALAHIRHAWNARGSSWASTVTQEGWELFQSRIEEAHKLLERAVELGVKDGAAFSALIEVAKAKSLSHELTRAYLNAGMKLDPTYMEMYKQMAVYLLPRWLGEPGDVEAFAAEIVERLPRDDGLDAYGQIAYQVNQFDCLDSNTLFWGNVRPKVAEPGR